MASCVCECKGIWAVVCADAYMCVYDCECDWVCVCLCVYLSESGWGTAACVCAVNEFIPWATFYGIIWGVRKCGRAKRSVPVWCGMPCAHFRAISSSTSPSPYLTGQTLLLLAVLPLMWVWILMLHILFSALFSCCLAFNIILRIISWASLVDFWHCSPAATPPQNLLPL